MKTLLALMAVTAFTQSGYRWQKGYTRSNGTYVRGHLKANPDSNRWNNVNPPSNNFRYQQKTKQLNNYLGGSQRNTNSWKSFK